MPVIGISTGRLYRRTILGLFGGAEERAPAEMTFLPLVEGLNVKPFVEGDRFLGLLLLHGDAEGGRGGADVDVVDVFDCALAQEATQDGTGDRVGLRQFLGASAEGDVQAVHGA